MPKGSKFWLGCLRVSKSQHTTFSGGSPCPSREFFQENIPGPSKYRCFLKPLPIENHQKTYVGGGCKRVMLELGQSFSKEELVQSVIFPAT